MELKALLATPKILIKVPKTRHFYNQRGKTHKSKLFSFDVRKILRPADQLANMKFLKIAKRHSKNNLKTFENINLVKICKILTKINYFQIFHKNVKVDTLL